MLSKRIKRRIIQISIVTGLSLSMLLFGTSILKDVPLEVVPIIRIEDPVLVKLYSERYGNLTQAYTQSEAAYYEKTRKKIYKLTVDNGSVYYLNSLTAIDSTLDMVLSASYNPYLTCTIDATKLEPIIYEEGKPILSMAINELSLTGSTDDPLTYDEESVIEESIPADVIRPVEMVDLSAEATSTFTFDQTLSVELINLTDQVIELPDSVAKQLMDDSAALAVIESMTESYLVEVPRDTIYVDDPTLYTGLETIGDYGYDGITEVTELIEHCNDEEINRSIISKVVLSKAVPTKILVGTKAIPEFGSVGFFVKPINNYIITSYYGSRWGRAHNGIDFGAPTGTDVLAADGGTVISSKWNSSYGYMIEIDHGNGFVSLYAHNSQLLVDVGDEVGQGQLIAKSGNTGNSTGPHLHFEIMMGERHVNPLSYIVN